MACLTMLLMGRMKRTNDKTVGIEDLGFYIPETYVSLEELAERRDVSYAKFRDGIGQERMAILPPDEDVVTMAAHAAAPLRERGAGYSRSWPCTVLRGSARSA